MNDYVVVICDPLPAADAAPANLPVYRVAADDPADAASRVLGRISSLDPQLMSIALESDFTVLTGISTVTYDVQT